MSKRILGVPLGCPLATYIKEGRRRWPARGGAPWGDPTRTPLLVGFGPLLFLLMEGDKGEHYKKNTLP